MSISIIILPFISFIIAGLISLSLSDNHKRNDFFKFIAWLISSACVGITFLVSLFFLFKVIKHEESITMDVLHWFVSGNFLVNITFNFNILTLLMVFTISIVSLLVHVYSYFYINKEDNLARFQAYLSLFTFSMILLVTSENLLQMFIGWELISFCSYLLIAFWFKKEKTNYAASKAFLINRFADIFFILGIFVTFSLFGTLNFSELSVMAVEHTENTFTFMGVSFSLITLATLLFAMAAFAKSAQIGLHIWLPDAMEAPTPVSALLHAATMVTAGVFLIVKLSPLYILSEVSSNFILIVATITTIYGAIVACVQDDIKKIIAYSTISQLGYMFLSIGVGLYNVAIFHLFTHAFFKALLFLGAGSVIHGVNGEQNIKKMGGLWKTMPITYITMWIGSLSLMGIAGFSGYYSKESILHGLQISLNPYANISFIVAIITIFFTAFYSFRLMIRVFHGAKNPSVNSHESSFGMLVVLIILSVASIFIGRFVMEDFVGSNVFVFWKDALVITELSSIVEMDKNLEWYSLSSIGFAFICIYVIYIRERNFSKKLINTFPITYKILSNKFYFDYIYDRLFSRSVGYISNRLLSADDNVVDKYGANTLPSIFYRLSKYIYRTQNGSINFYAFIMVLGLFIILTYCFIIFKDLL